MDDLIKEQKEQQRIEDNYWGKGSEPMEKIEEGKREWMKKKEN